MPGKGVPGMLYLWATVHLWRLEGDKVSATIAFILPMFWFEKGTCCPGKRVALFTAEIGDFRVCMGCKQILPCPEEVEA